LQRVEFKGESTIENQAFGPSVRVGGREKQIHRNVQRFRGGLVFKAHRLVCHSTLGLRVIRKKKKLVVG